MKKIISLFIILALCLMFSACGASNPPVNNENNPNYNSGNNNIQNQPDPTPEPEKPTAYEQLNHNEKLVVDSLLVNINNMNNPTTIKVLDVRSNSYREVQNLDDTTSAKKIYYVRIMGQNAYGATITKWCEVAFEDYSMEGYGGEIVKHKKGEIKAVDSFYVDSTDPLFSIEFNNADITKINAAITEHWKDLGFI